jgi:hypothetical protein
MFSEEGRLIKEFDADFRYFRIILNKKTEEQGLSYIKLKTSILQFNPIIKGRNL